MPRGGLLRNAARAAFHKAGGLDLARWMNRKGLRILMYHRFTEREPLARQCAHIRAHYSPVSMSQAADWLTCRRPLPENALAITVDDGYRDFYRVAYPVLREYGVPATVYLVSDFVDRSCWLWVDQVQYLFLHTQARHLELETPESRKAAARSTIEAAKKLSNAERLRLLETLPQQLGVQLPGQAPPEYEPLSWDEVREMAAAGIEFGAHTRTHPILSRLAGEPELTAEIAGSKQRIEQQLARAVRHFCYPNGAREDISPEVVDAVWAAGLRTAVTTESGLNHPARDPLRLLRIGVEPGLALDYFERCAAGFRV